MQQNWYNISDMNFQIIQFSCFHPSSNSNTLIQQLKLTAKDLAKQNYFSDPNQEDLLE
jgi:hypothetical protein